MRVLLVFTSLFWSFGAVASVATMKIDFKDYTHPRVTEFKQELDAEFGRVTTFSYPDKQQEIEVMVNQIEAKAVVEVKLYDVSFGQRNLMSQGRVLTDWGQTASVQTFKDEEAKIPQSILKVKVDRP